MKRSSALVIILLFLTIVPAQVVAQFDGEPSEDELGAPLYPGAVFIKKTSGLDPYYETSMYISFVPIEMVESFFKRKLQEKRVVYFSEDKIYLTIYLMKTWSKFPVKPSKDDLSKLESEQSLQIRYYYPELYESLAKFYEKKLDGDMKANALRDGKTMLLYTYLKSEKNRSSKKIIASWKETSRDLDIYYGSILEFKPNGTYTFTFTPENLKAMAKQFVLKKRFKNMSEEEIKKYLGEINPEKGEYVIMRNSITFVSENPIDGDRTKSGLADVGTATLSLELINKPRLSFIRKSLE